MNRIALTRSAFEEIVQHASREMPRECCGLVATQTGVVTAVHPITNTEVGTRMYVMDGDEVYAVTSAMGAQDETLFATYHSHPVTAAYPSRTDIDYAFWPESNELLWPEAATIICSMADPQVPVVKAFRINADRSIDELQIDIT